VYRGREEGKRTEGGEDLLQFWLGGGRCFGRGGKKRVATKRKGGLGWTQEGELRYCTSREKVPRTHAGWKGAFITQGERKVKKLQQQLIGWKKRREVVHSAQMGRREARPVVTFFRESRDRAGAEIQIVRKKRTRSGSPYWEEGTTAKKTQKSP